MREHVDDGLRQALYDVMLDMWWAYDDSAPLLEALRVRGVRTAVLSNVGVDIRPVMERQGLVTDAALAANIEQARAFYRRVRAHEAPGRLTFTVRGESVAGAGTTRTVVLEARGKTGGAADTKARSEALAQARSKLDELRGYQLEGAYGTNLVSGSDTPPITRDGFTYNRQWTVTQPDAQLKNRLVQVTVSWADRTGNTRRVNLNTQVCVHVYMYIWGFLKTLPR